MICLHLALQDKPEAEKLMLFVACIEPPVDITANAILIIEKCGNEFLTD
jgi:hypothetical protein